MTGIKLNFSPKILFSWWRFFSKCLLIIACLFIIEMQPAFAGINTDTYDGNIFVVYAGNGSLVPPTQTLAQTLAQHKPAVLAFYVEDSSDCKQYALIVSRIQEFYGRAAEIIPVSVDSILPKETYDTTEPGYYYSGAVPQVVLFNQSGNVVLNKNGQVPYEEIDDRLREVFDLLPRDKSVQLKRRSFNELNSEITQ
ncbi:thylakoid membrane photosystem I accumulation factor [Scytonema hofmannii FACHB-248]|uniref:Thylakoid membrane photosystem I accumulation factor n=1 Tax=Scytonema hofmannii FACHB-248 TaxID=1842502 RepID=A0ABR8GLQ0_9CYAN|nr:MULTISPECIES: thylakoid membrane photosystem I accumulation factor [Nostocales]MBD2604141.1 thylakoid membrane photosystem I accumulation factor [Scytonema hofmannii FACHB-248]